MTINRFGKSFLCSASILALAVAAQAQNSSSVNTEMVTVTASRLSDVAQQQQINALNIIDVQSAEAMAKYPDYNAAEALGRMPGISVSEDTGEGRYVTIRGLDGNLDGATYGGVVLLNTLPGLTYFTQAGRAVEFDTVPMGAIDGIVVTKTGLPDQEAEGLGGSIELTPRSAASISKPFFIEGSLGSGYEALRPNWSPLRGELTLGGRFDLSNGFSDTGPFSFVLTASWFSDRRAIDDIEEAYVDQQPAVPDKAYDALELRRYNYHRRRFGLGGEFEYNPSDSSGYYVRYSMAGYIESVNRQRFLYNNMGDTVSVDPSNPNGFISPNVDMAITLRDEEEQHRNTVIAAGGHNSFGSIRMDYEAAYSRATFTKGHDYNSTFDGPQGVLVQYDNTTNPNFPFVKNLSGTNLQDPSLYTMSGFQNSTEGAADEEFSYKFDLSTPLHLIGDDQFKAGVKARLRDKSDVPLYYTYGTVPATPLTSVLGQGPFSNFYQNDTTGSYAIGYAPGADKVRALVLGNPTQFAATPDVGRDAAANLHARENVLAGYVEYVSTFGDYYTLLAGVRVEHTDSRYRGITATTDASGNTTYTPNSYTKSYTNAFPTVQLRYQPIPEFVARATYSTGIARPGFLQASSATQIDTGGGTVTSGNPNLKPTTGNNFDLSFEYSLPYSGLVSFGFFDKEFSNFILPRSVRVTNYPGIVGIATVSTFENTSSSWARGIEANAVQKFGFLPEPFQGFGVSANATLVDSNAELYSGYHAELPGTSHWTANAAIFYEAYGAKAQLSLQYVGKTQFGITGDPTTDVFEDHRTTLDWTSSYDLCDNASLYFNAKNLTNSPLRFYEGSENRPIQREFYQYTLEWGVKFNY